MNSKREKHYRVRYGRIYARITYTDDSGNRRDLMRLAESKSHAKELAAQMRQELKDHGSRAVDADRMTFAELAKYYEEDRLIPAQYQDDRKVAGLRSLSSPKLYLKTLVEHFRKR